MNKARREIESRFLERVTLYREEYRSGRAAALKEERERQHARGEVYYVGFWMPRAEVAHVVEVLERRELLMFVEAVVLLLLTFTVAWFVWWLFSLLFLPLS